MFNKYCIYTSQGLVVNISPIAISVNDTINKRTAMFACDEEIAQHFRVAISNSLGAVSNTMQDGVIMMMAILNGETSNSKFASFDGVIEHLQTEYFLDGSVQ
ncbi:hypothetical protein KAMAJI_00680 [Serratia phage vB_SmaM-Kamaji]|nr:hypothetical protein KAMAJI_00680 [Serratia phage vB_SmaM-Kamaji]